MPNVIAPSADVSPNDRYAIVVAEWNQEAVTQKLLEGAVATFAEAGVDDDRVDVAWVPGAWEIPVATQKLADTCRYAGF